MSAVLSNPVGDNHQGLIRCGHCGEPIPKGRDLVAPRPVLSRDGRRLLSIGFFTPGGTPVATGSGNYVFELVLHDLSRLHPEE